MRNHFVFVMAICILIGLPVFDDPLNIDYPSSTYLKDSTDKLFGSDQVLDISLSGDIRALLNDRGDDATYHNLQLSYKNAEQKEIILSLKGKTRGHFRRAKENCAYPPILLNFNKSDTLSASIFKKQDELKLVMPCQGDEYIIHEWLAYKLHNVVTKLSFKTRLVRINLIDPTKKKPIEPFYGMLIEDENHMAKRNDGISIEKKLKPDQTENNSFLTAAVFEYMIGNTDWSVQYLQNIKLIATDSNSIAQVVAYDFDHAGLVNAPYARPAEELQLSSTRTRRYRGYCIADMNRFSEVLLHFNQVKPKIYSTVSDCSLLDPKYIKNTLGFLDDFYETINNPKALQKEFSYPCDKYGTGNVVIKGLRKD